MTDWPEIPEAAMTPTDAGLVPADDGWFVLNAADTPADYSVAGGFTVSWEGAWPSRRFADLGLNIQVLQPGESVARYHQELAQEDFLVLQGECIAIVEEQERPMRAWDLLHCPPGTRHAIVGAGDGPCALLMLGHRREGNAVRYPQSDVAARHGASVAETTSSGKVAYADDPPLTTRAPEWPLA